MKSLRRFGCALAIYAVYVPVTVSSAAEESDNAALAYWQAFAMLPPTDKVQDEILGDVVKAELGEHAKSLVQQSDGSFRCLRRATAMPECDWGLDLPAGPHMVMPHLSKARQMARFACLGARQSFQSGQADAALETLGDMLVLARRLGEDQILIGLLVQYAIEQMVIDVLVQELPDLEATHLDALAERLDGLPKGGSVRAAMETEQKVFVGWARRVVRESKDDDQAVQMLRSVVAESDAADYPLPQVSREQIANWLDETWNHYNEIFDMLNASPKVRKEKWEALQRRVKAENPFSSIVLPGLGPCCEVRDKNRTTWALFKAAIVIARDGAERLPDLKDPFGDGPFKYEKTPKGFRLGSQLNYRGKQVELTIGRAEKK